VAARYLEAPIKRLLRKESAPSVASIVPNLLRIYLKTMASWFRIVLYLTYNVVIINRGKNYEPTYL
jgi:hypothetical protein